MAVFRVEKNRGYTVMSNHHLRNKALSLKAKGLLSQMLSLPEDWDYTLKGLSLINRESIDAIRTAVWELEKAGYMASTMNPRTASTLSWGTGHRRLPWRLNSRNGKIPCVPPSCPPNRTKT